MATTLTVLRARARERADMVGSTFITDGADSLDAWINRGLEIVHQKLVDAYDDEYLEKTGPFTTAGSAETYALATIAADFLKLLRLELQLSGRWVTLKKFQRANQNAFREAVVTGASLPRYRLAGATVRILPVPANGLSGRIIYAPKLQVTGTGSTACRLVDASDTVDFPSGWEDYAVVYAAIQAKTKEDTDSRALMAELSRMDNELEQIKLNRDAAQPNQVVDVDLDDVDPYYL